MDISIIMNYNNPYRENVPHYSGNYGNRSPQRNHRRVYLKNHQNASYPRQPSPIPLPSQFLPHEHGVHHTNESYYPNRFSRDSFNYGSSMRHHNVHRFNQIPPLNTISPRAHRREGKNHFSGTIETDSIHPQIEPWTYDNGVTLQRAPNNEYNIRNKRKMNELNDTPPNSKRSKFILNETSITKIKSPISPKTVPKPIASTNNNSNNSNNNSNTTNFGVKYSTESKREKQNNEERLSLLSKQIEEYSNLSSMDKTITKNKYNYCNMLRELVRSVHRDADFKLFGSMINGFVMPSSDLDITLLTNNKLFPLSVLSSILTPIKRNKRFVDCELIRAKVPIIKCYDVLNNVDVDISINNHSGIKNSFLLKAYCKLDPRVRPLVVVIKEWAKNSDVCNSRNGKLSSYAISLMVIFFLQEKVSPPILPTLQKKYASLFSSGMDVRFIQNTDISHICDEWKSKNNLNLAQLLIYFFEFYSKFSYRDYVISVKEGKISRLHTLQRFRGYKGFINIEDPYTLDNVAQTVYCLESYSSIASSIRKKYNTLLTEIPDLQEFLQFEES